MMTLKEIYERLDNLFDNICDNCIGDLNYEEMDNIRNELREYAEKKES